MPGLALAQEVPPRLLRQPMDARTAESPVALAPNAADAFDATVKELGAKLDLDDIIAKLGGCRYDLDGNVDGGEAPLRLQQLLPPDAGLAVPAPAPAPVRYEEDAAARAAMPPPPRRSPPLRGLPSIGVEEGIAKGRARRRVRVHVLQHAQKPGVIDRRTSRKSPAPPGGAERPHFRAIDELLHGLEPPCGAARPACLPWGDASLCDLYA